jgi:hypothetical protein
VIALTALVLGAAATSGATQSVTAVFPVTSAESELTVEVSLGSVELIEESREAQGEMTATITENGGVVTHIHITALDLTFDDVTQSGNPSFSLEDFRAVMNSERGTVGAEVEVTGGQFHQTGNEVEVEGTIAIDGTYGSAHYQFERDLSEQDPVPVDIEGTVDSIATGLEITIPISIADTIETGLLLGDLDYEVSGTIVARWTTPTGAEFR